MYKLSIIVPVYNVEKYVRKCIESCLNQDLSKDEYEIIVVNDGTSDNSVSIVEEIIKNEYQKNGYCNIHIISRKNGGLSAARNTGLKEAKGEYVWFVDSDDWIEPNVLKALTRKVLNEDLDVLCFNLQLVYPDGKKKVFEIEHEDRDITYSGEDFVNKVKMPSAAWAAFYRRRYLLEKDLFFYEGIIHEDMEFTPRAYISSLRIAYYNYVVYNYYQREGGIMKSKQNLRRCKDLLTVADSLFTFAKKDVPKDSPAYNYFFSKVAFAFSQSLAYYESSFMPLNIYTNKEYYPLYISPILDNKTKWKYRLINLSISLYLKIYRFK